MYKALKESGSTSRDSIPTVFNSSGSQLLDRKAIPKNTAQEAYTKKFAHYKEQNRMEASMGLRDVRNPELAGWAIKKSHKKLMTDHKKFVVFHDHNVLWGAEPKDPHIGGCFMLLTNNITANYLGSDGEPTQVQFVLSDRKRVFDFGSRAKEWYNRINKSIRIRLTQGKVLETGILQFSAAAKIYELNANHWFDKGVAAVRLSQHVSGGYSDTALFCDNKSDEKHYSYLLRNKIVKKGPQSWIMHQTYEMSSGFRNVVLALRFFQASDAEHFKQAFDKSFPIGGRVIPNLPEDNLVDHEVFRAMPEQDDFPIGEGIQMPAPIKPHEQRISDISDTSFAVKSPDIVRMQTDEDLARQLQAMELSNHPMPNKGYHSDDEDSLFRQDAELLYAPVQKVDVKKVEALPMFPNKEENQPKQKSVSDWASHGKRRWLIMDLKKEVQRVVLDYPEAVSIIQTKHFDPQDDILVYFITKILDKDFTQQEIEMMILQRLQSMIIECGGPGDMLPVGNEVDPSSPIVEDKQIAFDSKQEKHDPTSSSISFDLKREPAKPAQSDIYKDDPFADYVEPKPAVGGVQPFNAKPDMDIIKPPPKPAPAPNPYRDHFAKQIPPKPNVDLKFDTKNLEHWDVLDTADWLSSLSLERYHGAFESMSVDGEMLASEINETFLTGILNVNKIHVKKIMRSLLALRAANS